MRIFMSMVLGFCICLAIWTWVAAGSDAHGWQTVSIVSAWGLVVLALMILCGASAELFSLTLGASVTGLFVALVQTGNFQQADGVTVSAAVWEDIAKRAKKS